MPSVWASEADSNKTQHFSRISAEVSNVNQQAAYEISRLLSYLVFNLELHKTNKKTKWCLKSGRNMTCLLDFMFFGDILILFYDFQSFGAKLRLFQTYF